MAASLPDRPDSRPTDRLDDLCDRFDASWKEGGAPRLESFLQEGSAHTWPELLVELLRIELWYLRKAGGKPSEAEYLARFHELTPSVRTAFLGADGPVPAIPGYRIERQLGAGGMGVVYLAFDESLRRQVALKTIQPGRFGAEGMARFQAEATTIAQLQHPNIVQVHDVCRDGPLPHIALEYVPGGSLADRIGKAPCSMREAAALVETLARAIELAHARGIVHRDLKPANVLLAADGTPKIADFGLAKNLAGDALQTQAGQVLGTPSYMAPEQALGQSEAIGPACDVYALGAILYELLTGRSPFWGGSILDILTRVVEQEPEPPRRVQPKVPLDLETICLKCLEKNPRRRYASAKDLAEDLAHFLSGEPIHARPITVWGRAWKWARRRPAVASLLGCLVAVVLGAVAGLTGLWLHAEDQRSDAEAARGEAVEQRDDADRARKQAETSATEAKNARDRTKRILDASLASRQREGIDAANRLLGQRRYVEVERALEGVPASRRHWPWHRLRLEAASQIPRPVQLIGTHEFGILALLASADGRQLLTSGQDGRLIRWDLAANTSEELMTGIWSAEARRWEHVGFAYQKAPRPPKLPECYQGLCWVEEGHLLAGASLSGRGVVYDLRKKSRDIVLSHTSPLNCVACSADGEHLLFGDDRGQVIHRCWRQQRGRTLQLGTSPVLGIVAVPRGLWIVGQADGQVSLIDLEATRVCDRVSVRGPLWNVALAPDGLLVAVACAENPLALFHIDVNARTLRRSAEAHFIPIAEGTDFGALHAVCVTPDGKRILARDDRRRLLAWDRRKRQLLFVRDNRTAQRLPNSHLSRLPLPQQRHLASIAVSADGNTFFTGGQGTALMRWSWQESDGITTLPAGPGPIVRFDRTTPEYLWVGDSDGRLTLWQSRLVKRQASQLAHQGAITAIDSTADGEKIVTCGADRSIRFWARTETGFSSVGTPIQHTHALTSVAFHPEGKSCAAYDSSDHVNLWEVASGRLLARESLRREGTQETVAGLVAFHPKGTLLAATGPGQTFWLLSSETLRVVERPYVVAGEGGSALAWHPREDCAVGGDTLGRIATTAPLMRENRAVLADRVVGLSFTPDGQRLAAASASGRIVFLDPRGMGLECVRQSSHPGVSGLSFDASGGRLAVAHKDGTVAIWETEWESSPPLAEGPPRRWTSPPRWEGSATALWLRPQAAGIDADDTLYCLHGRVVPGQGRPPQLELALGQFTRHGYQETLLSEKSPADAAHADPRSWSLALLIDADTLYANVRRPTLDRGATSGQLILFEKQLRGAGKALPDESVRLAERQRLTRPGNWGFFTHLFPGHGGKPFALHFSYATMHWLTAFWEKGEWNTRVIGRQGDGFGQEAALGPEGSIHVVFKPNRFGSDPALPVYVRLGSTPSFPVECREVPVTAFGAVMHSLAVTADGSPAILYSCERLEERRFSLVLARRQQGHWMSETVCPAKSSVSNLACDRRGQFCFAYVEPHLNQVRLAVRSGTTWTSELVWQGPLPAEEEEFQRHYQLVTLIDKDDRPVVLAGCSEDGVSWLRAFRSER